MLYSYDLFGNVDTLLQDMNQGSMKTTGNRFKKIIYNYDLISGKVNSVAYQKGSKDQFYHRYSYDAENRLTAVYTSIDGIYYERDATYEYYKHGPLGRTILGQQQVQGLDYAYTIQGWLKGMNSTSVSDGSFDMGGDGKIGGVNSNIARDAYGISLSYYTGDYKPINSTVKSFATTSVGNDLYNGNIKSQVVNIPQLGNAKVYGYGYDQLNRLTKVDAYNGFNNTSNTFTPISINDYKQRISYDANGNIKTFLRNGTTDGGTPLAMDNMVYSYKPGTNQLDHVSDAVAATNYSIDIDNQDTLNYSYDQIGNLTKNKAEGIDTIQWNVYGKISQIVKSSGTIISYLYDANGNRISKTIGNRSTHYVRDAQGNVMSVYTKDPSISGGDLTQTETPIYGSSRLGVNTAPVNVERSLVAIGGYTKKRGYIHYEGSNHKGTPVVIFTDKAIQHDDNGDGMVDYKTADIVSASDNYAFGSLMPGRVFNPEKALYGIDGKRKDNDIYGESNAIDFDNRILDTRLGRWFSVDPLQRKYSSLSPYNYVNNSPVLMVDRDGKDFGVYVDEKNKTITIKAVFYTDNEKTTISQVQAAANYLNSFSEQYNFESSSGQTYKIKMEMNVIPRKEPEKGLSEEQIKNANRTAALKDNEANYIENSGDFPLRLTIGRNNIGGNMGETEYGGDVITTVTAQGGKYGPPTEGEKRVLAIWNVKDPVEFDTRIKAHEMLHALGLDHSIIGTETAPMNENVIGAILQYASNYGQNSNKLKVDGVKSKWLLKITKRLDNYLSNMYSKPGSDSVHQPRSQVNSSDGSQIEIKGKVKKRT